MSGMPRPWSRDENSPYAGEEEILIDSDPEDTGVCSVRIDKSGGIPRHVAEENAALIVKAVNCHDKVVEALKEALKWICRGCDNRTECEDYCAMTPAKQVKDALALVEDAK